MAHSKYYLLLLAHGASGKCGVMKNEKTHRKGNQAAKWMLMREERVIELITKPTQKVEDTLWCLIVISSCGKCIWLWGRSGKVSHSVCEEVFKFSAFEPTFTKTIIIRVRQYQVLYCSSCAFAMDGKTLETYYVRSALVDPVWCVVLNIRQTKRRCNALRTGEPAFCSQSA